MFETLAGNFAEIVQYNKDNRLYQNSERSMITLETLCDIMVDKSLLTAVSIYFKNNAKTNPNNGVNFKRSKHFLKPYQNIFKIKSRLVIAIISAW